MLITYQTGKGADHCVPMLFPSLAHNVMEYLCNHIKGDNKYIFASTKKSDSHANDWHSITDILRKLDMKGTINATQNRHRVATLLAELNISEKEQELIY